MSVVPFRLPEPLAIISLDGANWRVEMFSRGDCACLDVLDFAIAEQVVPYVVEMYTDSWRLIFKDGTAGIRTRMSEALQ